MADPISILDLELVRDEGWEIPIVRILIDGEEIFKMSSSDEEEISISPMGDYMGFPPEYLLGRNVLLPHGPDVSVEIYNCGCGNSGCDSLSAVIEREGHLIKWHSYSNHNANDNYEGVLPTLYFNADQYMGEVHRAWKAWKEASGALSGI